MEFMYLVFTCMPVDRHCRRLGSLLLRLPSDASNSYSLDYLICTSALGLVLFQIVTTLACRVKTQLLFIKSKSTYIYSVGSQHRDLHQSLSTTTREGDILILFPGSRQETA